MGTSECNAGGNPAMDEHPIQGRVEILLGASCYKNRNKLRSDGSLCFYADLTYAHLCMFLWYKSQLSRKLNVDRYK